MKTRGTPILENLQASCVNDTKIPNESLSLWNSMYELLLIQKSCAVSLNPQNITRNKTLNIPKSGHHRRIAVSPSRVFRFSALTQHLRTDQSPGGWDSQDIHEISMEGNTICLISKE